MFDSLWIGRRVLTPSTLDFFFAVEGCGKFLHRLWKISPQGWNKILKKKSKKILPKIKKMGEYGGQA